jgi:hypothetical protein
VEPGRLDLNFGRSICTAPHPIIGNAMSSGLNGRHRDKNGEINLSKRSVSAPTARPATTSLVQCARSTIRVNTNPPPTAQTAFRRAGGNSVAAEAKAPIWTACPDGKASSRLPESGIPRRCPSTVDRSGRCWSNIFLSPCGNADATRVVRRTWSLARRICAPPDRAYSHQAKAMAH